MNRFAQDLRASIAANPSAWLVGVAVGLALVFFAGERLGVLPLQGQATPTYGTTHSGPIVRKKSSSSKRSLLEQRKAQRASSAAKASSVASSVRSSSSSSSSSPTSKWTGKECDTPSLSSSPACMEKMKAVLQGDWSCFAESKCHDKVWMCSGSANPCAEIDMRLWAYDAFFPECTFDDQTCLKGTDYLTGNTAPKAVQTCLSSTLCRELLATFRTGSFTCRKYGPCQDAMEAMVKDPVCLAYGWCANMKKIDDTYTNDWQKCPSIEGSDCFAKFGLEAFSISTQRRTSCSYDVDCRQAARDLSENLMDGYSGNIDPGCFLWSDCKKSFQDTMKWACDTVHREPMCTVTKNIWKFLTETNKSCVTSGNTPTCQKALKNLMQ